MSPLYAECPTVSVEVHVDATAADVWAVVSDIEMPARFSSELQGARWLEGATGPAVGARFAGRNRHEAIGEWETECVVVTCEPERSFAWAVGDAANPSASWRFDIEPDGDGVVLRQWFQMGPAPSGLTPAILAMPEKESRIIERRLDEHRGNMARTLDGVKRLVEEGGA